MAQIEVRLSSKIQKETLRSEVLLRFYQGSRFNLRGKTGVFIDRKHFEYFVDEKQTRLTGAKVYRESGEIVVKNRIESEDKTYHTEAKKKVEDLKRFIIESYESADKEDIKGDWLQFTIDKFNHPDKYAPKPEQKESFFDTFELFLQKRRLSDVRIKNYRVLLRVLKRYELFRSEFEKGVFKLELDTINKETIEDIESFIKNEHTLFDEYPNIFKKFPSCIDSRRKTKKPTSRGKNTICSLLNKLKAFFNWCIKEGKMASNPFIGYDGTVSEEYGTPYYITLDERNQIANEDLSDRPHLAVQRDIFIFQCLIGCRVSDLTKMKHSNLIDGKIEYIPRKTKDDKPFTVTVPLNARAIEIVERYKDADETMLLPFISSQKYNEAIKEIFKVCGITRFVTILNPTTGDQEQRPINEIASSHLARRTFVGNLYKEVKDPNLIGKLSGHTEGSKAFARYRDIDNEILKELVDKLN